MKKFKKRDYYNQSISVERICEVDHVQTEVRKTYDIEPEFRKEVSKFSALIIPRNLVEHQEIINALMLAIKPNLLDIFCKRFTKEMLKEFISLVRKELLTDN